MSKIDPNKLLISSDFYSVQGEGISTGVPSFFIRLGLCNLNCGLSSRYLKKIIQEKFLEDGEVIKGDLELEGKATWTCDSISQWAFRGQDKEFQYIIDRWKEEGVYQDIKDGVVHVIWTGGEPLMLKHQIAIINFHKWAENEKHYTTKFYNEFETNGTVVISKELEPYITQINCSPKLSNSGEPEHRRIKIDAIKRIMEFPNYQFKFVISTEEDVKELFKDFVEPFNIPLNKVICMPGLDDQKDFHERTQFCLEMAKKYRFIGMTRLHISAYNQTLNV